jgi:hypothetical protein
VEASPKGVSMGDQQFDDLTRMLASATSRRVTLKALASMVGGSLLSLVGIQEASALGRCRLVGQPCRQGGECCSFFCDPASARCVCPPGSNVCQRTRQCVSCPPGMTFNASTCQCDCPAGTTVCGSNACCASSAQCCNSSGYSFCCPPGYHCVSSPYGGVFCSY